MEDLTVLSYILLRWRWKIKNIIIIIIIIIIFIIIVGAYVAVCFLSDCMLMRSAQALASSRRPHHAHKRELRERTNNTHRNNAASLDLEDVDEGVLYQL